MDNQTTAYQMRKTYKMIQAQADEAAAIADASRFELERVDMTRKALKLNVAASLIHAAMVEIEQANMTAEQRYFASKQNA